MQEISLLSLFIKATFVVKVIMLLLLAMSFWAWVIIIQKNRQISDRVKEANEFEKTFWSGQALDVIYERVKHAPSSAFQGVFVAAMRELEKSRTSGFSPETKARIERSMDVVMRKELEFLEHRLTFLATAGSAAPFIGLFGTVWGIMHAFLDIASKGNTSLAVVAPGIAEALLATAIGLVAAIPATIAYNQLSTKMNGYIGRLETFTGEFTTLISRHLDK